MNIPDINAHTTPDALLRALEAYIIEADALLDEKNIAELSGLDTVVDVLCKRVLALTAEEGRPYAEQLEQLSDRLSLLQDKMVVTQTAIRTELNASNKHEKASKAYRKDTP